MNLPHFWRQICSRHMSTVSMENRGALIVLEGCDRSGKTTQCNKLVEKLTADGVNVKLIKFPDRTTVIGQMISGYLGKKTELEDHAVHLLFSANRWEHVPDMLRLLNSGTTLIVDRYAFSGVAFTAAKKSFTLDWCKQPDVGLPKPDKVLYLTLSAEAAARRAGFGGERYEEEPFQKRVAENFKLLQDPSWEVIDADRSIDDLHRELHTVVSNTVERAKMRKLDKLWTDEN